MEQAASFSVRKPDVLEQYLLSRKRPRRLSMLKNTYFLTFHQKSTENVYFLTFPPNNSEKYQFFGILQSLNVKKDLAEKNLYKVNFIILFAYCVIRRFAFPHQAINCEGS